ncbi:MAG: hypothetical protein D8M59_13790 [Planctomycetes bacterium]|nr:hypothetical protein [Planctomycetota bacterium]NOG55579.1 zf-TFIIB domain-containing protein [Planctomycetota bacterium]
MSDILHCPLCHDPLRQLEYEGITIEACDACGGEFLDADELGHVIRAREAVFPDDMRQQIGCRDTVHGIPSTETQRHINCPKCSQPMSVINYCGDSGIFVDRCEGCGGFWLDADELEHVQVFQEEWESKAPQMLQAISGDLERARREAAEQTSNVFSGSRFAFVNAIINRFLDAA